MPARQVDTRLLDMLLVIRSNPIHIKLSNMYLVGIIYVSQLFLHPLEGLFSVASN